MKVISYQLTPEGKIPDYVVDGGYFAIPSESSSPQDWWLLGVATNEAPESEITSLEGYFTDEQLAKIVDENEQPRTPEQILTILEGLKN